MISKSQIEDLRDKWQTGEPNIAREYVQHVLLSALYGGIHQEVKLAFKGGTALRMLRRSPRFSEDLDFTGAGKAYHVGEWIKLAVREASKAGLEFEITDSAPTTGGWFAEVETRIHEWPVRIEWNVSLREQGGLKTETVLVNSPLWTPYAVKALPVDQMVREKVEALIRRKAPRDIFDAYYILRARLSMESVTRRKSEIIKCAKGLNAKSVERDLKDFVPRSQWMLIKQMPQRLIVELERS